MIKGSIKGVEKLLRQAERAADIFELNRNNAVKEATLKVHELAIRAVSENDGGHAALRYNPKRTVTVSDPGSPPHTDTGRLRQSIKFNYKDGVGNVGSNYKVAAWLEFGTEDVSARPWLSVAVEQAAKEIADIFNKWFTKAVKDIAK